MQEGVHELPLARLDAHVPKAPFVGAVSLHGLPLHTAVSVRLYLSRSRARQRIPAVARRRTRAPARQNRRARRCDPIRNRCRRIAIVIAAFVFLPPLNSDPTHDDATLDGAHECGRTTTQKFQSQAHPDCVLYPVEHLPEPQPGFSQEQSVYPQLTRVPPQWSVAAAVLRTPSQA